LKNAGAGSRVAIARAWLRDADGMALKIEF
jgi:hypothetical protein